MHTQYFVNTRKRGSHSHDMGTSGRVECSVSGNLVVGNGAWVPEPTVFFKAWCDPEMEN